MENFITNLWLIFIIVTIANVLILKIRSKKYIEENSSLKVGYEKYFTGILFYGNIPWVVMGIGNITGMTQNILEYFNPRSLNPIVLIFHASIIFLWALSLIWLYVKGGAEFLETHPGLINSGSIGGNVKEVTAKQIKIFYPLFLIGGIAAMVMMWSGFFASMI